MRSNKNMQFCMDVLQSMQGRDGLEPEQRSALEKAKNGLKRLRRKPNPSRDDVFQAVRGVTEAIIKNFAS